MRSMGWFIAAICACASGAGPPPGGLTVPTGPELRCAHHHCDVQRAFADHVIRTLRDDAQAELPRIVPSIDRPDGIELFAIRPGSMFDRLGFRNGDVIRTVDGVRLVAARLRESLEPLAAGATHVVGLDRAGGTLTLDFTIVE
jgi:S1-C subfamily serine protease